MSQAQYKQFLTRNPSGKPTHDAREFLKETIRSVATPKKSKTLAKSEKALQEEIESWLKSTHGVNWIVRSATHKPTTNAKGTPDILFCLKGVPFALEVKFTGGAMSHEQKDAQKLMPIDGWNHAVVWDIEEVREFINTTLKKT